MPLVRSPFGSMLCLFIALNGFCSACGEARGDAEPPSAGPQAGGYSSLMAPPVVWSRGYFDLARMDNPQVPPSYFFAHSEARQNAASMAATFTDMGGWVWVRTGSHKGQVNDLATFVDVVLPRLRRTIRLISSDGDSGVPGDLLPGVADAILNHPLVTHWYTQNYDGSRVHPKLIPIPIGLDLHYRDDPDRKLARLLAAAQAAPPPATRPARVLLDVLTATHPERAVVQQLLASSPHVDLTTKRGSFAEAMQLYGSYRFVVSPRGNGLDCHRTWELIALGTLPIVRSSSLDPLYAGLPVVIVQSWEEIRDPANLERWYAQHAAALSSPGLHWLNRSRWLKP